jgi:CRISPR-associated protein Cmr4
MYTHLFKLECLTNLHVGNGDVNYSIIDNEVEKDSILTDVPIIHASGVKGALKEHFEKEEFSKENVLSKEEIATIFGDKGEKDKNPSIPGSYKFFDAVLLARPLRISQGAGAFILATSLEVIENYTHFLKGVGVVGFDGFDSPAFPENVNFLTHGDVGPSVKIEGEQTGVLPTESISPSISKLLGPKFAIASSLRNYALPVVARNVLENGVSKNLWYEEFVPHKSIFYFVIMTPNQECALTFSENVPVQFGGNASIGYGYSRVLKQEITR